VSKQVFVLVGLCALTFFAGLDKPAITDSDEAFYAESAREMIESGDWLTPHFNDEPRFEKPILYYWLVALTYLIAGIGEGAARFPSALAGLGLTLLVFAIARRLFDTPTGTLAGVITATSFGYVMMAHQALPDLVLALFITLTIWSAMLACLNDLENLDHQKMSSSERRSWLFVAAAGGAGAVLVKGPIGIALPILTIGPLMGWEFYSNRATLKINFWNIVMALMLLLALITPWFLGMTLTHGVEYLERFFVGENLERFTTARYNDPRPIWYYIPIVVGGMLPWSPFMLLWLPTLWLAARRRLTISNTDLRLIWWALIPLIFFTLSIGKQPRYVLSILPPLAILLARTIYKRLQTPTRQDRQLASCAALAGVILIGVGLIGIHIRPLFLHWQMRWTTSVMLLILISGLMILVAAWRRKWITHALASATIVTSLGVHGILLTSPEGSPVEQMAKIIKEENNSDLPYGRFQVFNRNINFYTERPFVELSALDAVRNFLSSQDRVLCVLLVDHVNQLEADGLQLRRLGEVLYVNTGTINLRKILAAEPAEAIQKVVLVSNQ
jgi:4-amino-4-deoxy-L-arabinose transferase-like glycosyltransferase